MHCIEILTKVTFRHGYRHTVGAESTIMSGQQSHLNYNYTLSEKKIKYKPNENILRASILLFFNNLQ